MQILTEYFDAHRFTPLSSTDAINASAPVATLIFLFYSRQSEIVRCLVAFSFVGKIFGSGNAPRERGYGGISICATLQDERLIDFHFSRSPRDLWFPWRVCKDKASLSKISAEMSAVMQFKDEILTFNDNIDFL